MSVFNAVPEQLTEALVGVHVVSIATNLPGPLTAARMAAMGATVTKFEPPAGDQLEGIAPGWFREIHSQQQVERVDLKTDAGRQQLMAALAQARVFITASRPTSLARLGVDELTTSLPDLLHLEIVGDTGNPDLAGHDLTYEANAGTIRPPHMPTVPLADQLGAEHAISATLGALLAGTTGRIRIGLRQAAQEAAAGMRIGLLSSDGALGGALPWYRVYATADGWVALAALEPHFRKRALQMLELTEAPSSGEALAALFADRSTASWLQKADELDVPLAEVTNLEAHR